MQASKQRLSGTRELRAPGVSPGGKGSSGSIVVQNISKEYKLYPSPLARVRELLSPGRKRYHRRFEAIADVSFTVAPGDTLGIIGKNGSGKTTLLQLLAGIIRPTAGSVAVAGRVSPLLELGLGFKPLLSGRQNISLYGAILGLSRQEIDRCCSDIVAFADLGDFIDRPVRTYSSGMEVRLAFALAIHVEPDILIIDEALGVGDALFQAKCFARFKELQHRGTTIILVTHALDLISRFCTKACLLDRGRLLACGRPKDVVETYKRVVLNHARPEKIATPARSGDLEAPRRCRSGDFYLNPAENRYGNGKACIDHIGIYRRDGRPVQDLCAREEYEFRIDVVFNEPIAYPIVSYRIKVENGIDICGTNTLYHNLEAETFAAADKARVSFSQKIALNRGEYFLSASCAGFEQGAYVVYDRRYDALPFRVTTAKPCDGLVDLGATVTLSRDGRAPLQAKT